MKALLIIAFSVAASSCGGAAMTALGPALTQAIDIASKMVHERTGNEIGQYPSECEQEYNPETSKLLILCEIDLSKVISN